MTTISTFHPFISPIYNAQICSKNITFVGFNCQKNAIQAQNLRLTHTSKLRRVKSSEENDQIPEIVAQVEEEEVGSTEPVETVAVPISPADKLLMFFQAEGTMSDSAIPKVTQALEGTEGISDLKVHISEGIATVEDQFYRYSPSCLEKFGGPQMSRSKYARDQTNSIVKSDKPHGYSVNENMANQADDNSSYRSGIWFA